jgi:hypothetical protein
MKWNYSLMRWCNAWMARALGEYKNARTQHEMKREDVKT